MIAPEHARIMARYNQWQNRSLVSAAGTLSPEDRWRDRGAFFGSIAQTLNHIYWDDRIWLARLAREPRDDGIPYAHPYTDEPRDWQTYVDGRAALDAEMMAWADALTETDLTKEVRWFRGAEERRPRFVFCVVHLFNHQTHHRGQVHAMLTMAGAQPEQTDLHGAPGIGHDALAVTSRQVRLPSKTAAEAGNRRSAGSGRSRS